MTDTLQPPDASEGARRSVAWNAASIFFGRLISSLSIWFALIVLAKLSDPGTVGIYALAQALCIPIAEIAKLGLKEVRSSDGNYEYTTSDYFNLRLVMAGVAFAVMLAAGGWQAETSTVLIVIALYALTRVAELMSDIAFAHFQLVERMDYIGRSLCMSGPLSLLALSFGYYFTGSLEIAVAGQLAAHLLVLFLHDLPISRRLGRSEPTARGWNAAKVLRLGRVSATMGVATLLIMVAVYVPRLWVGSELGLAALGIFGPVVALVMAPDRLVNALCLALSVRLARFYAEGRTRMVYLRIGQVVAVLLALGLPGIAICRAYGEEILTLVYSAEFGRHADLLVLLSAAALMRIIANVLGFGVIAARKFWWLSLQNALVAAVALGSCLMFIGQYGLNGAGYAMILIFGAQLLFSLGGLWIIREGGK